MEAQKVRSTKKYEEFLTNGTVATHLWCPFRVKCSFLNSLCAAWRSVPRDQSAVANRSDPPLGQLAHLGISAFEAGVCHHLISDIS